jgi:hypothetical protein
MAMQPEIMAERCWNVKLPTIGCIAKWIVSALVSKQLVSKSPPTWTICIRFRAYRWSGILLAHYEKGLQVLDISMMVGSSALIPGKYLKMSEEVDIDSLYISIYPGKIQLQEIPHRASPASARRGNDMPCSIELRHMSLQC